MKRDLSDATGDISADWQFGIAYNAALKLCTVLLHASGYRPEKTLQHYRTLQELPLILGPERKADADYLDACRTKRNTVEYDYAGAATPRVPLSGPTPIGHVVCQAMRQAGVERPKHIAAHLFRHTLASQGHADEFGCAPETGSATYQSRQQDMSLIANQEGHPAHATPLHSHGPFAARSGHYCNCTLVGP